MGRKSLRVGIYIYIYIPTKVSLQANFLINLEVTESEGLRDKCVFHS